MKIKNGAWTRNIITREMPASDAMMIKDFIAVGAALQLYADMANIGFSMIANMAIKEHQGDLIIGGLELYIDSHDG